MQNPATTSGQPVSASAPVARHEEPSMGPAEAARFREEINVLLFGFATGLSIGVVFLLYVVLSNAKLL